MTTTPTDPPLRSTYRAAEKAAFFAAYNRLESVGAAALELGLHPQACYRWLVEAGINPRQRGLERRAKFDRLRSTGTSRKDAARHVGVHIRTAIDWDLGLRRSNGLRLDADDRAMGYNKAVITHENRRTRLASIEQQLDARYLSLSERERIRDLTATGSSIRAIATALHRSPSTVSRELRRNGTNVGTYEPYAAHRTAAGRRPCPKDSKLTYRQQLRKFVEEKLQIHWSPEQICHALVKEHPTDEEMRVSPETIYQALYLQARGGLKKEVQAALRTGRTRRKAQTTGQVRRNRFSDPMVMIADRPPEIEDRAVPGHWEGDLITGRLNQSAIATLVERTTRYVMLVHLPESHTAEAVRDGLVDTIATLPAHLRGSLTWDQGSEMATHKSFTTATDMPVDFCDPASPWQRGSNENTNGLLRQYFPKSTDLTVYGVEDLERVAQELNGRPRKTLGWDTPAERFRNLLITT